jgi:hypothetical protein
LRIPDPIKDLMVNVQYTAQKSLDNIFC